MKTTRFPSLKNMTDDEILNYFVDHVGVEESLDFVYYILDECPETDLNLVEMFEQTPEFNKPDYDVILEFADRFRAIHPDKYRQEYEFIELQLTGHAFDTRDEALINRCLEVIEQNPAKGIVTVTLRTLYQLIYFGMYREAVDYCEKVWEPISNSDAIWGQPEIHFIMVLYMKGVEEQYELFCKGDTTWWNDFNKQMEAIGFDNEEERLNAIFKALTTDLDKENLFATLAKKPEYGFIRLRYHYLRFMKHRYNIPFMHSNLFFDLIMDSSLFESITNEDAWFYIPYPILDKLVRNNINPLLESGRIEVGGKLWGLNYVYEFLHENQLISSAYYNMMLQNVAWLKMDFLTMANSEAWHMKFVTNWPATDSDFVKLPENFFEIIERKDRQKALKQIKKLLPYVEGKDRIELEIKTAIKKKDKGKRGLIDQFFEEEKPPDPYRNVGRNDPCPCGSGKKYKKCCQGKTG